MKKLSLAIAMLVSASAVSANSMYINLPNNTYDAARVIPLGGVDANTQTGNFTEFGFSQILATSLYDFTDGSIFGSFFDTNIPAELLGAGVPTSGLALDGTTTVNLLTPDCPAGQCDIDALSPLVPPLGSDNEGFLQTWDLQVEYHFDGVLNASGPVYTGGYLNIFFNDLNNDLNDRLVLTGTLTGSDIQAANLNLFFDITFAEDDFLFVSNGSSFIDANDGVLSGDYARFTLDTNVNPPIPTANQLLVVGDNAIRQTTLDGSITAEIPEPGSIALLGIGLVGFAASRRKAA
jgi:hypothetical protein